MAAWANLVVVEEAAEGVAASEVVAVDQVVAVEVADSAVGEAVADEEEAVDSGVTVEVAAAVANGGKKTTMTIIFLHTFFFLVDFCNTSDDVQYNS